VRAECTLTFVGLKTGLFIGDGPEHAGALFFDDLEISPPDPRAFQPALERMTRSLVSTALPRRRRAAHKGTFGHVLVIGGGAGMPGAVRLAGEAALRAGAGLVTVATQIAHVNAIVAGCPELIVQGIERAPDVRPALERADVVAIGPGLGRSDWARGLLVEALGGGRPLVVDADALNLIAEEPALRSPDWILTPHPGEAARLLGTDTAEIQRDRLAALDALLRHLGGTVVLKGAGTLVGRRGVVPALCDHGNPGMASAGMGDVLTGAIAGVLAQVRDPFLAARVGVLVHALAGDSAARAGERGLLASDVIRDLRNWVNL
jgi:NAD(P)H-hydrate epimerase